jgi:hypothetical protein
MGQLTCPLNQTPRYINIFPTRTSVLCRYRTPGIILYLSFFVGTGDPSPGPHNVELDRIGEDLLFDVKFK